MEEKKVSKHQGKVLALFVTSILFLFFFNFNLASAAPPFLGISSNEGITVDALMYGNLKQNTDFTLQIHAYNTTSGLNLSNATTTCNVHLYNQYGTHLLKRNNINWDNSTEWTIIIDKGNFSSIGQYAMEAWCVSGHIGGSERIYFEVTSSGESLINTNDSNKNILLVLMIVSIGLILLGFSIKDEWVTALGGFTGTGLGLYVFINGIGIYNNSTTDMVGIIVIFFSAYVAIRSTLEAIDK